MKRDERKISNPEDDGLGAMRAITFCGLSWLLAAIVYGFIYWLVTR
jgi:hypothetical protein